MNDASIIGAKKNADHKERRNGSAIPAMLRRVISAIRNDNGGEQALDESMIRGQRFAESWDWHPSNCEERTHPNALEAYFDSHRKGKGIWKWRHYFEIYERHLAKFVGQEVHAVEVGIYSGGSLDMWKHYFGPKCHVYGVDIQPACKTYEDERTKIFIGDQADRGFWQRFKASVPTVNVLIDDGGHEPEQQIVTLEEILPWLAPGGVYICEDLHGGWGAEFTKYVQGLMPEINAYLGKKAPVLTATASRFQSSIHSIHIYPYVAVIEKLSVPRTEFVAPKHGTEWQPFFDKKK